MPTFEFTTDRQIPPIAGPKYAKLSIVEMVTGLLTVTIARSELPNFANEDSESIDLTATECRAIADMLMRAAQMLEEQNS